MQGEATAIDPGNGETEGLAAHHVGELRLPGVEDLAERDPAARGQLLQGGRQVGIEGEAGKGVEVALDQVSVAAPDAKVPEGFIEGPAADLFVGAVRLTVVGDVALLPVVPERAGIQVRHARVDRDGPEHRRSAARRVDESAVDVEGQQRGQRPITWRTAASTRAGSPSRWVGGARG